MDNRFDAIISKYAKIYNVPFGIIKAIIKKESKFNSNARGDVCGKTRGTKVFKCPDKKFCSFGLGQANWCSGTAQQFWKVSNYKDLFNPEINIKGIANYLKYQYSRYGSWLKAISAYNAGSYTKKNGGYVAEVFKDASEISLSKNNNAENIDQPSSPKLKNDLVIYLVIGAGIIIFIYFMKKK